MPLVDPIQPLLAKWDGASEGAALHALVSRLYPICRSITGEGVRQSLRLLQTHVPLQIREVPTGQQVFDWTVPREWNIRDAYVKNAQGVRVIDFQANSLHVVGYSVPVRTRMRLAQLREHVFTLPETPDWIPYRTSYYKESWGFCVSQRQWDKLADEEYEVCIDSSLEPGHLSFGEFRVAGQTESEVLLSCHSCHPALCNDNLSGMVLAARLAELLQPLALRYSYRFLWVPGTIGAITWLSLNEAAASNIKHGLVLTCLGDPGGFTYKRSRQGMAEIDCIMAEVLGRSGKPFQLLDFSPKGYDERQYCSPGFNLPVGCFMRTPNGKYPQYHTSADNLDLVTAPALAESLQQLLKVVQVIEQNRRLVNLNPKCEPQLGRRGLYRLMGGTGNLACEEAMLWVLNFSDGSHTLLEIAHRSKLDFPPIAEAAALLTQHGLLRPVDDT